ncbi:acyltransferase family protein [Streptomyces sp. NPDC057235]|uniref:acyltransferase family protein n=1 Tax=Streptomyces sp. NPDC057235 TaxID=3346058 RepID=UPI003644669E
MAASGRDNRMYALDGLRLVVALMVVFYHYVATADPWGHSTATIFPTAHHFARFGWLGVEIFFLISGFVICMSVWGRTLGDFAISRLTRLFPAYWVAVLMTAIVVKTWPVVSDIDGWGTVITNLTMLQGGNNTPSVDKVYWTLFVELKFYLLMAVVVFFGVTYRTCLVFCGVWTAAAALAPVMGSELLKQFAMPVYAPYFIAGMAFYLMRRYGPNAILWTIVGFQLLLSQRYVDYRMEVSLGRELAESMPTWPARLVVVAGFALVGAIALGAFDRVRWKWLTHAGAITYPLYLIHMFIGMTIIHELRDRVPAVPLVVMVTVGMMAVAWLIHRFVERPVGTWMRAGLKRAVQDVRRETRPGGARVRRDGNPPEPTPAPAARAAAVPAAAPAAPAVPAGHRDAETLTLSVPTGLIPAPRHPHSGAGDGVDASRGFPAGPGA